jgi:hypothetical protein
VSISSPPRTFSRILYLSSIQFAFRIERRTFVPNAVRGVLWRNGSPQQEASGELSTLQHLTMHYDVREPLRAEEANRICHACARPRKRNFVIGTLLDTGLRVSEPCSMATPGSVATRVAVRQRKGRSFWQAVKGKKGSRRCPGRRASNPGLNLSGALCKNPLSLF